MKEPPPLPVRIGSAELGQVGRLVAIRAPRELDGIFRQAGGSWDPGSRRWLIERRRIDFAAAAVRLSSVALAKPSVWNQ
jgi:hypothetical protein